MQANPNLGQKNFQHGGYLGTAGGLGQPPVLGARASTKAPRANDVALPAPSL